ncbi:hypothetical protein VTP01DRAFT_284 [Rhizomucor pusillus]|uniref:uncharacterized protein n=1 Tax=Rhizomucor pusillus TaxID=4840 RepID=UPI0037429557
MTMDTDAKPIDAQLLAEEELKDIGAGFFSDDDEYGMQQVDESMANVHLQTPERPQMNWVAPFNVVSAEEDPVFLLRLFYDRFFPYKTYFQWLNYDTVPNNNFTHREFSFTLASEAYLRYNSFSDMNGLKKEIQRMQPVKIDIGAVYSVRPKDKNTVNEKAFRPKEKELVFDIDMTDYDEIRTCCSGGDICHKCWQFMTISIKVIDAALREDFGFEHLLWVYSGRRGVHCWVCDERARKLDNESRKAIVQYLEVIKGGSEVARKVNLPNYIHPSLKRSLDIVRPYFSPLLLEAQGILDTPESWKKVLAFLPNPTIREELDSMWSKDPSRPAEQKWNDIKSELKKSDSKTKKTETERLLRDLVLQYSYPRLDDKVSIQINHLLKSPFCVHPKTQRVCVPIQADSCESFDPLAVPTLSQLSKELENYEKNRTESDRRIPDYKKTSLKSFVEVFEKFVNRLLLETQREKRDEAQNAMEF